MRKLQYSMASQDLHPPADPHEDDHMSGVVASIANSGPEVDVKGILGDQEETSLILMLEQR